MITSLLWAGITAGTPTAADAAQSLTPVGKFLDAVDHTFATAPPDGPHKVGVNVQSYRFQDRQLQLTTWYPANPAVGAKPYETPEHVVGTAVKDAPLDRSGGPYPLILFSPGLGAPGDGYYFYTQNLASQGYVVISIDHLDALTALPGMGTGLYTVRSVARALQALVANNSSDSVFNLFSDWFKKTQFGMTYRPAEISFTIDQAVRRNADPKSPFHRMINTNDIGMTGHSLGAAYTLLKGGMPIYCDYPLTAKESDVEHSVITDVNPCAMSEVKAMKGPFALQDPRIKAVVPLAAPCFIKDSQIARSAAQIRTPLMFINGDDPKFEASFGTQYTTYNHAVGPKYFVEVKDTDHFVVTDMIEALPPALKGIFPADDHRDFAQKADIYKAYSTAFFNRYLKGDTRGMNTLHTKKSPFVTRLWFEDR
ncbi:alpha/beta hydrolase family protein [Actinomadura montaniterrae]|uniref:alpha/beta hydrolase family protein n=1 Tax=Actinomadura montaniterrae TaxID=1803903 RepID=UPI00178C4DAA|nr:hypothetical protein [Actinomadura montaniterrae]